MADKNVVILGGKGMLGTDLAITLRKTGIEPKILDLPDFDITNQDHLQNAVTENSIVINCAAYTNVEKAEEQTDLANQVNGHAVGRLGQFAKKKNAWLLHISTDFVFDGTLDRPYKETDQTNPINAYGKSKLLGETLLTESACQHCIIRVEWTYGHAGNNFIKKIIQLANTRDAIKVVDDQTGSPTWTLEAAKAFTKIINIKPTGIYHFASSGYASRFETAKFITKKIAPKTTVKPCKNTEFPTAAKRPLNSRFDCGKITDLLGTPARKWQDCLNDFLEQI